MLETPVKKGRRKVSDEQSDPPPFQPLVNPLPPAVVALALGIFAIELVISAGVGGYFGGPSAVGWRIEAIRSFAFFNEMLAYLLETHRYASAEWLRFLTYPFVHLGFTHALMVIVFLLALGKLVGDVFGSLAVLTVFFTSALFGALVFAGLTTSAHPLVGGYPAVYGLIGTYTFLLWVRLGQMGEPQARAFGLIGVLLFIQLIFGLFFGAGQDWVAEIAGFLMGFAIAPALAPGGFRRLLDRLRQR